jgi:hypothetical protein
MTSESDQSTIVQLRDAMADEVRGHHLDQERVLAALAEPAPRRTRRVGLAVAGGLIAAAAVAISYVALQPDQKSAPPAGSSSCSGVVVTGALPAWARSGFSDRVPVMPHVLGTNGAIIAILWADPPLYAPPKRSENNKILWVTRDASAAPLVIHATLGGSKAAVTRRITVGPSIVNMPSAGCWTFQLAWHGHRDTLRLPYTPRPSRR